MPLGWVFKCILLSPNLHSIFCFMLKRKYHLTYINANLIKQYIIKENHSNKTNTLWWDKEKSSRLRQSWLQKISSWAMVGLAKDCSYNITRGLQILFKFIKKRNIDCGYLLLFWYQISCHNPKAYSSIHMQNHETRKSELQPVTFILRSRSDFT